MFNLFARGLATDQCERRIERKQVAMHVADEPQRFVRDLSELQRAVGGALALVIKQHLHAVGRIKQGFEFFDGSPHAGTQRVGLERCADRIPVKVVDVDQGRNRRRGGRRRRYSLRFKTGADSVSPEPAPDFVSQSSGGASAAGSSAGTTDSPPPTSGDMSSQRKFADSLRAASRGQHVAGA